MTAAASAAAQTLIFNILVMPKQSGHYVKVGQRTLAEEPSPQTEFAVELDGRALRCCVDQVYIPPGCDEHCLGTLFLREL